MTPAEHAKVWRKAADSELLATTNPAVRAAWHLAQAVAAAYEQLAKEQESPQPQENHK